VLDDHLAALRQRHADGPPERRRGIPCRAEVGASGNAMVAHVARVRRDARYGGTCRDVHAQLREVTRSLRDEPAR